MYVYKYMVLFIQETYMVLIMRQTMLIRLRKTLDNYFFIHFLKTPIYTRGLETN